MISLPQLEQYCHEYLQSRDLTQGPIAPEQHGPLIALEGIEESGRAKICVFTIIPDLTIEEIMKYLRSRGVSRLVQIQSIHYLEQLPVLGSGKIDYKTLKNLIVRL
jgi:non-ribosomal peptide synthetase component E (peptide arylation enzyme)